MTTAFATSEDGLEWELAGHRAGAAPGRTGTAAARA